MPLHAPSIWNSFLHLVSSYLFFKVHFNSDGNLALSDFKLLGRYAFPLRAHLPASKSLFLVTDFVCLSCQATAHPVSPTNTEEATEQGRRE